MHLRSLRLKTDRLPAHFPFSLPLFHELTLEFTRPVTFFVGENGSGKSTLLEGLAAATGLPTVGGIDIQQDHTLEHARRLGAYLRLSWSKKTRRGFFLRAEDFFNFARRLQQTQQDLQADADYYEETLSGYGLMLAKGVALGQRQALIHRYGENLDANSHGESFLKLFQTRVVPGGLYLLDEPETPLSPLRQLTFLSLLKSMVEHHSQFIIATHSPILMAFPDATILQFDPYPVQEVAYEAVEHVQLTRDFLNNPARFLRHL
ncbi:MAG: ATP-binding cassette domain-containing protein [Gemmatimonadetes bacterium]|nr:MAG: ATP-binding cassette domain-containing protein [Gemmatimonadota bacterium]